MALPKELPKLTIAEYLDFEEGSSVRHEYVAGQVFAMAGATDIHNIIAGNVFTHIRSHLRKTGCRAYIVDMKLRVEAIDAFYYPDVMATCEAFAAKSVFKSKPILLVEVLSPSTELIDRREKLSAYFQIETLREYVLIAQDEKRVEVYRRNTDQKWQVLVLAQGDGLHLDSLPNGTLTLTMEDIYEDVPLYQPPILVSNS